MRLVKEDEHTTYSWELITHEGLDEYRVKRSSDGLQTRILLSSGTWSIFSGDDLNNKVTEGAVQGDVGN